MKTVTLAAALSGLLGLSAVAAPVPTTFSASGTFEADDDVALIEFDVLDVPAYVTARTYSYAGGTLSDGTEVPAGGFDPILSLFEAASGALVAVNNDGDGVAVDPETGGAFDALWERNVPVGPGSYVLAVTQYDNFNVTGSLADGFDEEGDPNFTSIFDCEAGQFCDFTGADRTGEYGLDVTVAPVPVPAAAWLLLAAVGGLGLLRRRL